jgi:cysteine desulfurase
MNILKGLASGFGKKLGKKRIYLDYASVTPVDERVLKYVSKISKDFPANPSSLYKEGVAAQKQLEGARAKVAKHLDAHADEIVFTSGGTESNNLAIQGVLKASSKAALEMAQASRASKGSKNDEVKDSGPSSSFRPHIISSVIEHPSVRELLLRYREEGICDVTLISVNAEGIVDLKELRKALRPENILVSIMYVNNEIGTIQPIAEISKIVRHYKKEKRELAASSAEKDISHSSPASSYSAHLSPSYPYVHTDACQAVLFCPLRVLTLGVDMMTLDSAKFYGPRSVGALYVKRNVIQSKHIAAMQIGGNHEQELRAGTENVAGISGFAHAMDLAIAEKEKESERLCRMRDSLVDDLKKVTAAGETIKAAGLTVGRSSGQPVGQSGKNLNKIPQIIFNGSYGNDPYGNARRVPNNVSICVPGMDAEFAVLRLDVRGVCVSSVTSCRSKNEDSTSYVVEALNSSDNSSNDSLDKTSDGGSDASSGFADKNKSTAPDCGKSSLRITLGRFTTEGDIAYFLKALLEVLRK